MDQDRDNKSNKERFQAFYEGGGPPPWDIGRPQPDIVRLAEEGAVRGEVLDAGCGTGEHALYFASRGHLAWGIDSSPKAIARAQVKAQERGLTVTFRVADALALAELGHSFDTVIDSGLFHVFADPDRIRWAEALHAALRPGGACHILCFSDEEPGTEGPRRVSQAELRATFAAGWRVGQIRAARFESLIHPGGARAWLASLTRLGD